MIRAESVRDKSGVGGTTDWNLLPITTDRPGSSGKRERQCTGA